MMVKIDGATRARAETDLDSRLRQVLDGLSRFSGFGGVYFGFDQRRSPVEGLGVCRFCAGCLRHPKAGSLCQNHANAAAVQGFAIGDVWYCRCWLGVDCFVVPVAPHNEIIGAIEVGGYFSPGEGEATQHKILSRLSGLDSSGMAERFVTALQGMRELAFGQVTATARFVLDATFANGLNQPSTFGLRQKIFQQQQRLNRRRQARPSTAADTPQWPLSSMMALLAAPGDVSQEIVRRQAMDDFLISLLLDARGDLTRIKAGLLVLCGLLARRQAERGATWLAIMGRIDEKLLELEKLTDAEALCFWAENLWFPDSAATTAKTALAPVHSVADRVHDWLRQHYAEPVGLNDVAAAVGASRSNLIHKLKKDTGKTFGDMLLAARMSEAKRLLSFTSLSISELCRRCGFQDQSYFTKVFRREINLTPREFRRLLTENHSLGTAGSSCFP